MNKVYITGDMHGKHDISKFNSKNFPEGKKLTKDDYVIVLGDFGLLWNYTETSLSVYSNPNDSCWTKEDVEYYKNMYKAYKNGACFDSRCFNIPKEEVTNYFYWRQLDATRNSIQMVGQHYFKHRELQGVSCRGIQNKLLTEKDINWNNYSTVEKRGTCVVKRDKGWIIDTEIPIFRDENREYIETLI